MTKLSKATTALFVGGLFTVVPPVWAQTGSPVLEKEGAVSADAPLTMFYTKIQENLKEQGFNPGPIDGIIGPKTHEALRSFQSANNLKTTGQVNIETAQALGVDIPRNVRLQ